MRRSPTSSAGPFSRLKNDRPRPHYSRTRLAIGAIAGASAKLPVPAVMLGLCDYRLDALWGAPRKLAGLKTHLPLPSMGRPGLRPCPRQEDPVSERQSQHDPRDRAERFGADRLEPRLGPAAADRQPAG